MSVSITYTPGKGYTGYLPGCDRPAMRWGTEFIEQVKERAKQNFTNKAEYTFVPNAPAIYNPLETFERRELTKDELAELATKLATKYDPANMTQDEYDSLLDELVKEDILSRNELGPLGYHGFMVVGSLAEGGTGINCGGSCVADTKNADWNTYFSRYGYALSLRETDGNALAYTKLMSLWKPTTGTAGWLNFAEKQCDSFTAVADILEAMQNHRKS